MELAGWFGKNITANFGDVLNPYIFYKIFNKTSFEQKHPNCLFLGIGSILHPHYTQKDPRKSNIVFGSGIRNYEINPGLKNADIFFVRGPISAQKVKANYITDSAYLFTLLREYPWYLEQEKKHKLSYMPYISHVGSFDWEKVEAETGVKIILPTNSVEDILLGISQSQRIISSAMHGCIMADILRVPFKRLQYRYQEGLNKKTFIQKIVSENTQALKWQDWLSSVGILDISHLTIMVKNKNYPQKIKNLRAENETIAILKKELIYAENYQLSTEENMQMIRYELYNAAKDFSAKYDICLQESNLLIPTFKGAPRSSKLSPPAYKPSKFISMLATLNLILHRIKSRITHWINQGSKYV